uniref:Putative ovule protein n=1 Tax=Solanum chacoense TaxID=4108 RepID=A0A0V0HIG0_SOLCH
MTILVNNCICISFTGDTILVFCHFCHANIILHIHLMPYLIFLQKTHKISKQELEESVQELAARAAGLAKTEAAKNITAPNSAYQFEVSWRGLSGDRNLQTQLLKVTSPAMLPRIFKNALSAPMLMDIVRCVATFFIEDMNLAIRYLEDLTKVPRFDMIIMCLSSTDKSELLKIWEEIFCKEAEEHSATLGALRSPIWPKIMMELFWSS